jgi:hypothetical protein
MWMNTAKGAGSRYKSVYSSSMEGIVTGKKREHDENCKYAEIF